MVCLSRLCILFVDFVGFWGSFIVLIVTFFLIVMYIVVFLLDVCFGLRFWVLRVLVRVGLGVGALV